MTFKVHLIDTLDMLWDTCCIS